MRRRRGAEEMPEEWEQRAGELPIGHVARYSPYDGLTDEQADKLQAELEEKDARRIPLGFRLPDAPR